MKKEISLYLHIPFCIKKCNYCDFLSFPGCGYESQKIYIRALCREIEAYREMAEEYRVISIFFGGGTPSVLELEQMEEIFHTLSGCFHIDSSAEISVEINPGTVDKKKLIGYRQLGVNRLSIGLQSTNKEELAWLGRIHNYDQFLAVWHMAREAGFDNMNVDLMSGLPGQTALSYRTSLTRVLTLKPEHISAYSLTIEEGTPFWNNNRVYEQLPDEETERAMYAFTKIILEGYGYRRYEISNYAKEGRECRHNITYWTGGEYLGLGLGASSYIKGRRFHNTRDMQKYCSNDKPSALIEDLEVLDVKKHMEEFMFLGLRMMKGVSKTRFRRLFGREMYEVYGNVLNQYEGAGLLSVDGDFVRLTEQGISVSNMILADFLL